jgi:DNA-binding transcriptional LysR family regulator
MLAMQTLVRVVETGQLLRGGARAGQHQSAVSKQVAALERDARSCWWRSTLAEAD